MLYRYRASLREVINAETVVLDVDLGFQIVRQDQRFRIEGIATLGVDVPGGQEAVAFLSALMPVGQQFEVQSWRTLADVYEVGVILPAPIYDLSSYLVRTGWAASWNGSGEKPMPAWPRVAGPSSPHHHAFAR